MHSIRIESKRSLIVTMINNDPTNIQAIMDLYDEYKAMWGNGYIRTIYEKRKANNVK